MHILLLICTLLISATTCHYNGCTAISPSSEMRIVSLSPATTEILFALELEKHIVGVTRYCDRPSAALGLPRIGGFSDPQLEAILALRPTLVIGTAHSQLASSLMPLRDHNIQLALFPLSSIADIRHTVKSIGKITHRISQAHQVIASFNDQLNRISPLTSSKSALFVISANPLILAGPGTFPEEAWKLLGGASPLSPRTPPWPHWSLETLIHTSPFYLIATGGPKQALSLLHQLHQHNTHNIHVLAAERPIFVRPGIYLPDDVALLTTLKEITS